MTSDPTPIRRIHGTIIVSYGRVVSGTSGDARELLRTLHSRGAEKPTRFEVFDAPDTAPAATGWWAEQLDEMFSVLTDPVVFVPPDGTFDPARALQSMLSVEQLFRRVYSIQLADHDTHARRPNLFSAMDTLTALTAVSYSRLFDCDYAQATLERLERSIPFPAQEILLPAARRGVAALRSVRNGFFMASASGHVRIERGKPVVTVVKASAEYMRMLRDATHGFSTTKASQQLRIEGLLASHTGEIGHDIGALAWLYLLDLLSQPNRLRKVLSASGRGR